jgi:hypothetical protein
MEKEYDFENAKRSQVVPTKGKTRIAMYLDTDIRLLSLSEVRKKNSRLPERPFTFCRPV